MPKVFVVHNKSFDLSKAEHFGPLVILYDGAVHDVFLFPKLLHTTKQKLASMTNSDYLLLTGNLILNVIAFGIVLEKFGFVNLLLHDIVHGEYIIRVLHKHSLKGVKDG